MSAKDRLATNVDALEILARLVHEGRTANAEERNTLGKFRGWGGVDMTDVWNVDGLLRKGRRWDSSRRENVTDVSNPYHSQEGGAAQALGLCIRVSFVF